MTAVMGRSSVPISSMRKPRQLWEAVSLKAKTVAGNRSSSEYWGPVNRCSSRDQD